MSQLNLLGSMLHPLLVALDASKSVFPPQNTPVRSLLSERTTERRHHPQHRSHPSHTVVVFTRMWSAEQPITAVSSTPDAPTTRRFGPIQTSTRAQWFTPSQEPRAASRRRFEILQGLHHSACHRPAIRSRPSWRPCWRACRWPVSTCTPAFDTIRSRVDRRRPCCLDLHDWQ